MKVHHTYDVLFYSNERGRNGFDGDFDNNDSHPRLGNRVPKGRPFNEMTTIINSLLLNRI